jgi:hypothetical protein
MGKTIFAAVIASVLTAVVTVLIMNSLQAERTASEAQTRETKGEIERIERDRIAQRLTEVEKRVAAAPRAERRSAASEEPQAVPPATAPDGTPYVSRAELEAFAKDRKLGTAATDGVPQPIVEQKPVEKKTLEEIAREQGLSAGEEANLRNILRESEEELVHCLFGSKTLDEIKADVVAAHSDPEKEAELTQSVIQSALQNVGKLVTLEKRTKKRVNDVLGEERGKKFMDVPRKPVIAPELEGFLKDFGD